MMSNEKREAIYLRNRSALTPAQRRRVKAKTAHHELVGKLGRLRRVHERKLHIARRREIATIVGAVRAGALLRKRAR